jgi:hypothetical protein
MLLLCLDIQVLLSSEKALIKLVISAKAEIHWFPDFLQSTTARNTPG